MFLKVALVAFDYHHVVSSPLLHHRACRFHLRVEGVHQGDGAVQIQPIQQPLADGKVSGSEFVGAVLDQFSHKQLLGPIVNLLQSHGVEGHRLHSWVQTRGRGFLRSA